MDVTPEDTSKVIALMRSKELYSSASYIRDMHYHITALEAALATARAETLDEVEEAIYGAMTVSDNPQFVRGVSVTKAEVDALRTHATDDGSR
jgi:hypothetical protein